MDLLPANLELTPPIGRRFRSSRLGACLAALLFAGAAAIWAVAAVLAGSYLLGGLAAFCGLIALIPVTAARRSFRPDNWLLGLAEGALYVKLRSHLNVHLPPEDRVILRLSDREIAAVRPVRERREELTSDGKALRVTRFVDLRLRAPWPPALDEALAAERARRVKNAGKWHDYAVTLPEARTIRLRWSGVEGGVRRALRALGERFAVEPEIREGYEPGRGAPDPRAREDHILALCERGERIAAMSEARAAYGMTLAEAKDFVDAIMEKPTGRAA